MTIHYFGRLSPFGEGARACGEPQSVAASYDLGVADCAACKLALVGTVIIHAQPGSVEHTIAEVEDHRVALTLFGEDRMWVPWRALDVPTLWRLVRPAEVRQ